MAPATQKINLKDKVEDGEIDLSMSDLQEVPIKEIIAVRKAHSLDLSNNRLSLLPNKFSALTNLIKLDLSKNQLKELPENFGDLVKLKHLDLYKNELQHLPLSFSKLKALKWLDLKDNPLVPAIASIAGPCLESKQCQKCAKDVVTFYSQLQLKVEEERKLRDEQRQKSLLENAQKAKQEKKNKKDKKSKSKGAGKENGPTLSNNFVKKTDANQKSKEGKAKRKPKSSPLSVVFGLIKCVFLIIALLGLTLFVVTAAKIPYANTVEDYVVDLWNNNLIKSLPPNYQTFAIQAGNGFKYVHNVTGEGVLTMTKLAGELNETKVINVIFSELTAIARNVTQASSEFYVRIFGK